MSRCGGGDHGECDIDSCQDLEFLAVNKTTKGGSQTVMMNLAEGFKDDTKNAVIEVVEGMEAVLHALRRRTLKI